MLAAATAATGQLRLAVATLEILDLDEEHVRAHGLRAVGSLGVEGNQIARYQRHAVRGRRLAVITFHQGKVGFRVFLDGLLLCFLGCHDGELAQVGCRDDLFRSAHVFQHEDVLGGDIAHVAGQFDAFPVAAVDGIFQGQPLQVEVVAGFDARGDFLDIAGIPVAARANEADHRLVVFGQADEVIIGQAHAFAADDGGDVVLTFLGNGEFRRGIGAINDHGLAVVVQHQFARRKRRGGGDLHLDAGVGQGAHVTQGKDFRVALRPFGVVVGEFQALDAGHVHHGDFVLRAAQAGGADVVAHVFLHGEEGELETRRALHHLHVLPVAARFAHVDDRLVGIEAFRHSHDAQVGATAYALVARSDVERLRRQQVIEGPAGQQVAQAVVHHAGTGDKQHQQDGGGKAADGAGDAEVALADFSLHRVAVADTHGVLGQEVTERVVGFLHLRVGFDTPAEIRGARFHLVAEIAVDITQGADNSGDDHRGQG